MKAALTACAVLAVVVLGAVQAAAVALFGPIGANPSVPGLASSTWPFALAHATGVDGFVPVRIELARGAFVRGDLDRATALLAGLPEDGDVADLRGGIALARGDVPGAIAAFGDAIDSARARDAIATVGVHDPAAAYALALAFERSNLRLGAPAPVIADSAWRAGGFAATAGLAHPDDQVRYRKEARGLYGIAVRYDPGQETYWLSEGYEALATGDAPAARDAYRRALQLAPKSVDALVGLAVSDARTNECDDARGAIGLARRLAFAQHRRADPAAAGFDATSRAALQQCLATGA